MILETESRPSWLSISATWDMRPSHKPHFSLPFQIAASICVVVVVEYRSENWIDWYPHWPSSPSSVVRSDRRCRSSHVGAVISSSRPSPQQEASNDVSILSQIPSNSSIIVVLRIGYQDDFPVRFNILTGGGVHHRLCFEMFVVVVSEQEWRMPFSTGMTHLLEGRAKHERSVAAEISNLLECAVQLARLFDISIQ